MGSLIRFAVFLCTSVCSSGGAHGIFIRRQNSHENLRYSLGFGHSHHRLWIRSIGEFRTPVRPRVRSVARPPRFRRIVAMLSLLPGRDLRGTSDTRVAEARRVVKLRRGEQGWECETGGTAATFSVHGNCGLVRSPKGERAQAASPRAGASL
jgi:hypothetical protein